MLHRPNLAQPLRHEETATSYVSRLTRYVGVDTPFDLCRDLGLEWQAVVRGEVTSLRALAALGGADEGDLLKWSIQSLGGLQFRIGQDIVPNKTLLRSRTRLCPKCVVADLDAGRWPYRRFRWNLRAIRTCEAHKVPLIQLPHLEHTFGNYDFLRRVDACLDRVRGAARTTLARPFTAYEAYLMTRLRKGRGDIAFADGLSLGTFCRMTESLGLALFRNTTSLGKLSDGDLYAAGARGFEYLGRGEAGLQEALTQLQTDPLQSNASHKLDFGAFWQWLRLAPSSGEIATIRHLVREFVFAHYPIQRGTDVLGVPCPKTRIYSVNSAKQEHGISRKRLVRCLIDFGAVLPAEENSEGLVLKRQITAEDIDRILSHRAGLVHRKAAAALLGGTDKAFRQLRLEGRVRQHMDGIDKRPMFDPREVEAFLRPVLAAVPAVRTAPRGTVPLPRACQDLGTGLIGAADLVCAGRVASARRVSRGIGLEQIVVDPEDLRAVIKADMTPAVPKLEAAAHLRTSLRTIDHLIREGHLDLIKRGRSLKGHDFPAVSKDSLNDFLQHHTTVGRIAAGMGLSFMYVMHAFDRCGVDAVPVPKGVGRYYERAHLKERSPFMTFDRPNDVDWEAV